MVQSSTSSESSFIGCYGDVHYNLQRCTDWGDQDPARNHFAIHPALYIHYSTNPLLPTWLPLEITKLIIRCLYILLLQVTLGTLIFFIRWHLLFVLPMTLLVPTWLPVSVAGPSKPLPFTLVFCPFSRSLIKLTKVRHSLFFLGFPMFLSRVSAYVPNTFSCRHVYLPSFKAGT